MRTREKKFILILIIITIILIVIKVNKEKNNKSAEEQNAPQAGYAQTMEDGTKQSTSSKLTEIKTFGDFEMSNIQIVENAGTATLTASVKNMSSTTKNEFPITIKLLDENGEVLQNLGAYVGTTKTGESRGINASINMDISLIYDIDIEI